MWIILFFSKARTAQDSQTSKRLIDRYPLVMKILSLEHPAANISFRTF